MIALDASFLVDYLDGTDAAGDFLDANEDRPFFAPTPALFEVYRGGARSAGVDGIERIDSSLEWIDPLPLTVESAREAALVEAELLDAGEPINLGDVIIAGICRVNGAELVTRDDHYDRIEGLRVRTY